MVLEEFDLPIINVGQSRYLLLTPDVRNFLGIDERTEKVRGCKDLSKHGKFIGVWNPAQQEGKPTTYMKI
jgi:hypothetical protein